MKMAMYHSVGAPSDPDSREVIGKHFVCCLLILMFDYFTSEQFTYVTGPTKIDYVSANYTELYLR